MELRYLLILCLTTSTLAGFAQTVSLDIHQQPLDTVLQSIARQTGYAYLTDGSSFEMSIPVSISFRDTPLMEALQLVFEQLPFTYELRDGCIWVRGKEHEGENVVELQEVEVSNGYSSVRKSRSTSSIDHIPEALLNRTAGSNIMDRLEFAAAGLLENHGDAARTDQWLIRGRSTIYADARPLVILDHFPYDGDLGNLNPHDIATADLLKDAAAASLWGARAGNGVIVLTSKKGETPKPSIHFTSNFSLQGRPDLSNVSSISSTDFIELEKKLFDQNYYNKGEAAAGRLPLTPVVELLIAKRDGLLDAAAADQQMEAMKQLDVRKDISRYLYQPALIQRYALDISGYTGFINYYLSAGLDQQRGELLGERGLRNTLRSRQSFQLSDRLTLQAAVSYIRNNDSHGANAGYSSGVADGKQYYPYARLADGQGKALPVYLRYRQTFTDAAESQGLLNWSYSPIANVQEEEHRVDQTDILLQSSLQGRISPLFSAGLHYQYEDQQTQLSGWFKENAYYTRDRVNRQVDPKGGSYDANDGSLRVHQARIQLDINNPFKGPHRLDGLAGFEIRELQDNSSRIHYYGDSAAGNPQAKKRLADNFLSYYVQGQYSYADRIYLSGSIRKDEANLFGATTNQRGAPFWSLGAGWKLKFTKMRLSYGLQGNIARQAAAYTIAKDYSSDRTELDYLYIVSPPNAQLSWEQTRTVNVGLDLDGKKGRWSCSLDVYHKQPRKLMGKVPLDPSAGLSDGALKSETFANIARMRGYGAELRLQGNPIIRPQFRWHSVFMLSYSKSALSSYPEISPNGTTYLTSTGREPQLVSGQPLFGLYSVPWLGLDNKGQPTSSWPGELQSLRYHGSAVPLLFGSWCNNVQYRGVELSCLLSYKGAYYFRQAALSYISLLSSWSGHGDYARRWQQPGDELDTQVPAFQASPDPDSERAYQYASIHVQQASHIRLEDVRLAYRYKQLLVSLAGEGLGLLWKANKKDTDPYYNNLPKPAARYMLGLQAKF